MYTLFSELSVNEYPTNLTLPVSIGEAIDKLTILDIKRERITDNRKKDVQVEYDALHNILQPYCKIMPDLVYSMKKVNDSLWDMMDQIRDVVLTDVEYNTLCKKTILYNDVRFRIKYKINQQCKSILKEQKGYKISSICIKLMVPMNDLHKKVIKYFSYMYDVVYILPQEPLDYVFKDEQIRIINSDNNILYEKTIILLDATDTAGISETELSI
jgi:hypothetical protein